MAYIVFCYGLYHRELAMLSSYLSYAIDLADLLIEDFYLYCLDCRFKP
jgi:hypothetical protein